MNTSAREEILSRLKKAPFIKAPDRPEMPPSKESAMDLEELVQLFTSSLEEQTGVVYRVGSMDEVTTKLTEILNEEGFKKVMASNDDVINSLNLVEWGGSIGVEVLTPDMFKERNDFKKAVFDEVEIGITGCDFAVAETGTLVMIHNANQARLVSLAPAVHLAIVPLDRMVPVYERAIENAFAGDNRPPQVSFISGPSMTADIQATMFKGMHGPRRVIVILVG